MRQSKDDDCQTTKDVKADLLLVVGILNVVTVYVCRHADWFQRECISMSIVGG